MTDVSVQLDPATPSAEASPAVDRAQPAPSPLAATQVLAWRELVRFLRQRNRVIGALVTPILFWLMLGLGMGDSFQAPGTDESFLTYFFPGMLLMVVLFTAIFSTITLIEDRREGFMQGVLVSPVPRWSIVLGKVLGGTILAAGQGMLLLAIAPLAGLPFDVVGYLIAAGFLVLLSFGLVSLGVCIAWPLTSTQGYHVAMNLLLMPLWFLSGAVFPIGASKVAAVGWVTLANPLTYGLAGLRRGLNGGAVDPALPGLLTCAIVIVAAGLSIFALASFVASRASKADLES